MAKKRNARRQQDAEDDYETASSMSTGTFASRGEYGAEDGPAEDADPFEEAIDALYEKRTSTREGALQALNKLLAAYPDPDAVYQRLATLTTLFLGCIRKGSALEATQACRASALLVVLLGKCDEAESLQQEAYPVLRRAAQHGSSVTVRVAAIEALSMAAFVAAEAEQEREAMLALQQLWSLVGPKPAVAAAAMRGWALLLSATPAWQLTAATVDAALSALADALHSSEVAVRAAAGETIALLYCTCGLADLHNGAEEAGDGGDGEAESSSAAGSEPNEALHTGLNDVVDRMKALATNRGDAQRRSKRDRAELRVTFRDLCGAIEGNGTPQTKLKLRHGDSLIVDTLPGNVQLNAFRELLADGFQAHLQHNGLLHQVFSYQPQEVPADRLTPLEKRLYRSPASAAAKSRSQQRNSARRSSAAAKSAAIACSDF